ncbi:PHD finger protein 14 isoform X2 [Cylas formicarius]|uniref:PHD finger protein 14 isoform X2 n=1 Tax=Cylas formicarius TaxID=197179 RepID=UPI0029583E24|nr:PHD finger protein 14 isoform X2 [Cylas formicarius]
MRPCKTIIDPTYYFKKKRLARVVDSFRYIFKVNIKRICNNIKVERDPNKRRVKPVEQACVLDFDEESSDDSDFRIEDHPDVSDDDDDSLDSHGDGNENDSEENGEESDGSDLEALRGLSLPNTNGISSIADVIEQATIQSRLNLTEKDAQVLICCGCLGDQSDGINEIVECDSCGVTVHEACYGVSDSASLTSTDSLSPTAPWFCEACRAGVMEPICELCPNSGGIFKETDVGKWVHLICALYVPGVAFGEVDKLTSVTLFEMPYSKWGAKSCSLCTDDRFARTGVCIGCDAGMCRTYFHVTCAQREGFLSEAHSEEVDQADPFYAHCKLHSDKTLVKRRKRNYLALQLRTHYRKILFESEGHMDTPEQVRIQRKLVKQKVHYLEHKKQKQPPWVPTQKMPRLITTSASAVRKLLRKAELMGINTIALEMQEAQTTALVDVRKKWHIPPAFTVEFIAYYLDRNDRLKDMKKSLETLVEDNKLLLDEQQELRGKYDNVLKKSSEVSTKNIDLKTTIHKYHSAILSACPTKNLPDINDLGKPSVARAPQPMMVPTAAALKMGVGFPLKNIPGGRTERILSSHAKQQDPLMLNECGICRQRHDQHMLAKCDTCHLYYHMNCLNPPLSRLPKKSKLYGWQCSECDKSSDSEIEEVKTPRRSRSRYSREHASDPETPSAPKLKIKPLELQQLVMEASPPRKLKKEQRISLHSDLSSPEKGTHALRQQPASSDGDIHVVLENDFTESHKSAKKRRREKHRNRYSPELGGMGKEHKRKRKKKSLDMEEALPHPRITIKIKPIPLPAGEVASESNPQCFYVPNEADDNAPPPPPPKIIPAVTTHSSNVNAELRKTRKSRSPRLSSEVSVIPIIRKDSGLPNVKTNRNMALNSCDVCRENGSNADSVKCDECQKLYHFSCLDPPLKKTPKRRGYSWHCADCDPTASE